MLTEQPSNKLRATAQINREDYLYKITEENYIFIKKLSDEMSRGEVSASTIEELIVFLEKNRELIMSDLPEHIIRKEINIRNNILKILANGLNLSTPRRV